MLGIHILSVKFDSENQLILAEFTYRGQQYTGRIAFQEIENIFSDSDSTNEKGSNKGLPSVEGIKQPPG